MKYNYDHIDPNHKLPESQEQLFRKLEPPFGKSREEAWAEIEARMEEQPKGKIVSFRSYKTLSIAIAAAILLLAGVFSLMRFYTTDVYCPAGEHLAYVLPDGSKVELNADSKLSFQPYWWRFSRKMEFEGEGYFEVEKGKKFEVVSPRGTTTVLGTTFNIYSRESEYNVTCITGKVKVVSFAAAATILGPEYQASVEDNGDITVKKEAIPGISKSWTDNMFNFTSRPLAEVLREIGRQYGVTIILRSGKEYYYTGYFSRNRPLEEVLTLVCKPFGLTFARIADNKYEIFENQAK